MCAVSLVSLLYKGQITLSWRSSRGSFWWWDILKLQVQFKGLAMVNLEDGCTYILWHDIWEGQVWSQACPELFSYARNQQISLSMAASMTLLPNLFHLPLSSETYVQFQNLLAILQSLQCSKVMMLGPLFRAQISSNPGKYKSTWLVIDMCIMLINGYGNHLFQTREKSSSSWSSKTGLALELCSNEGIYNS